jgi:catechol 2,3-dioxygenase-like lactoylglutathione lyase family enzyme
VVPCFSLASYASAMQFRFDAVFYYVSDLERAIRFYTDVLDLRLRSRDVVARFDLDSVLFELVPTVDKSRLQGRGNARLCLRVDDMSRAIQQLQDKGVRTTRAEEKEGGILAFFFDPDGNEICLWQYSADS